jgi:hypothetical protein
MKAMNIDITKIVHLDLRNKNGKKFSDTRIKFIANHLQLDVDFLISLVDKFTTVWFIYDNDNTNLVLARTGDIGLSVFQPYSKILTDADYDVIKAISPVEVPNTPTQTKKVKVSKTNEVKIDEVSNIFIEDLIGSVELDVDTILDKISDSGMASLTKREVEFLNNLNK